MTANRVEDRAEWLRNALGELTPKQRFVVECHWGLRDGLRYNFSEIARLMGVSHVAVVHLHRRAWKRLNHHGGLHLPFYRYRANQPATKDDGLSVFELMGGGEPVCLSPLIPSEHGLTHDEAVHAAGSIWEMWWQTIGK